MPSNDWEAEITYERPFESSTESIGEAYYMRGQTGIWFYHFVLEEGELAQQEIAYDFQPDWG